MTEQDKKLETKENLDIFIKYMKDTDQATWMDYPDYPKTMQICVNAMEELKAKLIVIKKEYNKAADSYDRETDELWGTPKPWFKWGKKK